MKIALVVGTLGIGGTETQLCRMAREFQDRGHEVKIFVLFTGGPLADQLEEDSITFEVFDYPGFVFWDADRGFVPGELIRGFSAVAHLWSAMWRFEPDVCHAFLPWAYMLAMPGAAIGRVPARIAARRSLSSALNLRRRDRFLQWLSVATAHAIVANSRAVELDCALTERGTRRKLRVIPNGLDLPTFVADVERTPPEGIMVANLIGYKGHDDLIDAVGQMRNPPKIRLVGDGPERARLESTVCERGLEGVIRFEGSVPDARTLFAEAQFSVLTSHQEGMPNAVLEAMAAGLPVVATSVGGIPELIADDVEGLIVPPHNPGALATAIHRIAADPDLRARLGSAARHRAANFTWPKCIAAHEDLYTLVWESHRRKPGRNAPRRERV